MADPITALPTPPSTSDPDNFDSRADAFLAALVNFVTETNAVAAAMNLNATSGSSATSNSIGTGAKTFTADTGKSWLGGMFIVIADTAAPSTNSMLAQVTSYNSGTGELIVDVKATLGSGTKTAWTISQTANPVPLDNSVSSSALQAESVTPSKLSDDAFIGIIGESKNLIITNNSGTPNSKVDIDADEIILKDADGRAYLAEAVNLTVDITVSGANGLDTGTEASGTWYYEWAISNGTTVAGLLSISSTAPTMPSGYTYKALVGAIYNDGSSNFIKILQHGNRVNSVWANVTNTIPTASYVSISLAAFVPPNAKSVLATIYGVASSANTLAGYISPANTDDVAIISRWFAGSGSSSGGSHEVEVPISTPQTVYYKRGGTAFAAYEFNAHGWTY